MNELPKWIERAKETFNFHRAKKLADPKWNTIKTAKSLRRSLGGVSEDLLIARYLKTHSAKLEKYKYAYEALEYIRDVEREEELGEIE